MVHEDGGNFYICNPVKVPLIWETRHLTDETSGKFKHLGGYIDFFKWPNFTSKWIAYPGIGERISQSDAFTGCIGQLQRGESDFMFYMKEYPSDIENVTQGHVTVEQAIGYIGSFHFAEFRPFTFENEFASFDLATWMTILSFLIFLRLFIAIKLRMMRRFYRRTARKIRRKDYTYRVLAHFSRKGEIESNTVTMKATWMVLSLFSFFMFTIFCNLMGTGLVMSKPPLIFENYDDLIKYNVKLTFAKQLTVHHIFANAKAGTPEHKLWMWATKQASPDEMVLDTDFNTLLAKAIETANYQRVFVSMEAVLRMVRTSVCHSLASGDTQMYKKLLGIANEIPGMNKIKDNHYQTYIRYPKSLKPQMMQIIYSKYGTFNDQIHAQLRKIFERGFWRREETIISTSSMTSVMIDERALFGQNKIDHDLEHDCMQSIPVVENKSADELSFVTFESLKTSLAILLGCILISSIFYLYEFRRSLFNR